MLETVFCDSTLKRFPSALMIFSFTNLAHSSYLLVEFMTVTVAHSLIMCWTLKGVEVNFLLTPLEMRQWAELEKAARSKSSSLSNSNCDTGLPFLNLSSDY